MDQEWRRGTRPSLRRGGVGTVGARWLRVPARRRPALLAVVALRANAACRTSEKRGAVPPAVGKVGTHAWATTTGKKATSRRDALSWACCTCQPGRRGPGGPRTHLRDCIVHLSISRLSGADHGRCRVRWCGMCRCSVAGDRSVESALRYLLPQLTMYRCTKILEESPERQ
jgi:hypothetical protein